MPAQRMHADEVETDVAHSCAGCWLRSSPQWAELPVESIRSAGMENALYRLGDEMVARLPRIHRAVGQVEKEQEWLPRLAPLLLPLAIPAPLALGTPAPEPQA